MIPQRRLRLLLPRQAYAPGQGGGLEAGGRRGDWWWRHGQNGRDRRAGNRPGAEDERVVQLAFGGGEVHVLGRARRRQQRVGTGCETGLGPAMHLARQADGAGRPFPRQMHDALGVNVSVEDGQRVWKGRRHEMAAGPRLDVGPRHVDARLGERLPAAPADNVEHRLIMRILCRNETYRRHGLESRRRRERVGYEVLERQHVVHVAARCQQADAIAARVRLAVAATAQAPTLSPLGKGRA